MWKKRPGDTSAIKEVGGITTQKRLGGTSHKKEVKDYVHGAQSPSPMVWSHGAQRNLFTSNGAAGG